MVSRSVTLSMPTDPVTLSLIGKSDGNSDILAYQISDGLVRYDHSLRPVPRVAESWEVSPDGKTVTFRLREGVRFHDGAEVTAEDVVFTIAKIMSTPRSW